MEDKITARQDAAKALISQKMKQIALITGDDRKASVYASAMLEISTNRNLMNCSVDSVIHTAFSIVQAGLNPNPLFNEAYVVPFKTKYGEVAKLQVGVKGYVVLGYRAGWVFKTRPVYKCDEFSVQLNDFDEEYSLVPNFDDRREEDGGWVYKNLRGVLVLAKDSRGNLFREFVPFAILEKIRLKSQNQTAKGLTYIWKDWAKSMFAAKALKYVIKRLPINDDVISVVNEDEKFESNKPKEESEKPRADFNGFARKVEGVDIAPITDHKKEEAEAFVNGDEVEMVVVGGEVVGQKDLDEMKRSLNE